MPQRGGSPYTWEAGRRPRQAGASPEPQTDHASPSAPLAPPLMLNNTQGDLPRLALALEYVDMGAALYLAGGSDHAARLLAAAAERLLGDLCRMLGEQEQTDELQALLQRLAERYAATRFDGPGHQQSRGGQSALARAGELGGLAHDKARQETEAFLRACFYLLESIGLEAAAPLRLREAIDLSTIHAHDDF